MASRPNSFNSAAPAGWDPSEGSGGGGGPTQDENLLAEIIIHPFFSDGERFEVIATDGGENVIPIGWTES